MRIASEKVYSLVVDTTAVELQIKLTVKNDVFNKVHENITKQKVRALIDKFTSTIENPFLKNDMYMGLSKSFKSWYRFTALSFQTVNNYFTANNTLVKTVENIIAPYQTFIGTAFEVDARKYVTDNRNAFTMIEDYEKKRKQAYSGIAENLAESDALLTKGVSLRNLSEIEVRRQMLEKEIKEFKDRNTKLVWCSTHANCSERCEKWQGKLYSLDGSTGVTGGINYEPLENAVNVKVISGGKTYINGLLGFNCRHRLISYVKGSKSPLEYSKQEIKKERAIDSAQRKLEREIRQEKMKGHLLKGIDANKSKEYFEKAKMKDEYYREFSNGNGRPYYQARTQVSRQEIATEKDIRTRQLEKKRRTIY